MKSFLFRASFLAGLAAVAAAGQAQGDPQTIARIVDQGKNHSQVMNTLTTFCNKFGPRLTGSPELAAAQRWAMDQFKRYGCTDVHLEQWGEIPVGFDRGPTQVARMVAPL